MKHKHTEDGEAAEMNPQKSDENMESSSTGSDGGKGRGSGSGGGYSADCSSSDASSEEATKGAPPEKKMQRMKISSEANKEKTKLADSRVLNKPGLLSGVRHPSHLDKRESMDSVDESKDRSSSGDSNSQGSYQLPQWNGIRIQHPMDPRIDISTVGRIQASIMPVLPSNVDVPATKASSPSLDDKKLDQNAPSIDQYMKLMEVVRPFFDFRGLREQKGGASSHEMGLPVPEGLQEEKHEDGQNGLEKVQSTSTSMNLAGGSQVGSLPADATEGNVDLSDSSSMLVLARVKRKHSKNKPNDDPTLDVSNISSNYGSNTSSGSSSEKKVRIQHPQEGEPDEGTRGREEDNEGAEDLVADSRQESTSATSSSEERNPDLGQEPPLDFRLPAVVSEYGSSRTGSSGASNSNQMSTSGSGSAGNSGSGTASGSNQGGSSGSGNDHGGISSNGNGSSASGNDVKGSSEDFVDNSGENNSGGNSDGTNSNEADRGEIQSNMEARTASPTPMIHKQIASDPLNKEQNSPSSNKKLFKDGSEAIREKKLQDKKRKRMNMRREYEEQVQMDMESSEGSRGNEEEPLFRPGRPVTLDKVLSFTDVPLILVRPTAPFSVILTNAAYTRLSGINSHTVVGKPISSLLSLPNGVESQLTPAITGSEQQDAEMRGGNEAQDISAATALQAISIDMLIANSGFGEWRKVNVFDKPVLGRDFTMMKSESPRPLTSREEGSDGSSITSSYQGSQNHLSCSMAVSPVVGSSEAFTVQSDKDNDVHKTKRRKHQASDSSNQSGNAGHPNRRTFQFRDMANRKRQLVTHYVIQLGRVDSPSQKSGSLGSQSSVSNGGEARILGLPNANSCRRRASQSRNENEQVHHELSQDVQVAESASSSPLEAIG